MYLFKYVNMISLELYLINQIIINYINYYNNDVEAIPNRLSYPLIILGTLSISCFIKMLFSKKTV